MKTKLIMFSHEVFFFLKRKCPEIVPRKCPKFSEEGILIYYRRDFNCCNISNK
jgi:hypothetical protein